MPDLIQSFQINSLIEYHDADGNVSVLRILASFPQDRSLGVINIYEKSPWPFIMTISSDELRNAAQLISLEPFESLLLLEDNNLTPARLRNRNNAWEIMEPIIFSAQGIVRSEWFSSKGRTKLINARAKELTENVPQPNVDDKSKKKNSNKTVKPRTIKKYAQQIFIRGLHKNAPLNDYHKVGKPKGSEDGKARRVYTKRPGRKPRDIHLYENSSYGIIINERIEGYFTAAIDAGLRRHETLEDIYNHVLDKHFSSGTDANGRFIHLPDELCPTPRQLGYHYSKLRTENPTKYQILRHGKTHFYLNSRPLTGTSMFLVDGPGAVYQGDSTPMPFALVSELDSASIIRVQHLYTIIDCFSEMYVGWSLDYRQGWIGARSALLCAFTSKKRILEKYELSDLLDAFPAAGTCKQLVVDNGSEWTGKNSDSLPELQIELANPQAYRPDLKGGVESLLGSIQQKLRNLPGSLLRKRERGDKDPRLTAALNRFQFMRMLICEMAEHNRNKWIENYPLSKEMIEKEIDPVPVPLWHYGVTNISGALSTYPDEFLLKTFLPRDTASIDRHGIKYKGLRYISQTALDSQMLVRAKLNGTQRVTISYNPDDASAIYLHLQNGEMEKCKLSKASQAFNRISWDDIDTFTIHYNHRKKIQAAKRRQGKSDMKVRLLPEQASAVIKSAEATKGLSKKARVRDIDENTEREKKYEKNQTSSAVVEQPASRPITGYVAPPDYQDEIDKLSDHSEQEHQNDK